MRHIIHCLMALALTLPMLPGCADNDTGPEALMAQHEEAFMRYLGLIEEAGGVLQSAADHQDADQAVASMQAVIQELQQLRVEVDALQPLSNEQMTIVTEKVLPAIEPAMQQMREGMQRVVAIVPLKEALDPSMQQLSEAINSVNSPTVEQLEAADPQQPTWNEAPYEAASAPDAPAAVADEPQAPSAFVVIQNASPTSPQLLVQQLQQVLPKTQVVKQVQSPDTREIRLEVTNTRDVRALANKIPFASVESVNDQTRTITVDFDL